MLLRNKGGSALPLDAELLLAGGATVAVIGPNADNEHSTQGGYTQGGASIVTVLGGAVTAANASGNAFTVHYERGACLGATPGCDCPVLPDVDGRQQPLCGIENASRIADAATLAAAADVTSAAVRSAGRERPWALASREICNKQGEVPVFAMHAACERARFGRHGRGDAEGHRRERRH